jgi:hypothetical protein
MERQIKPDILTNLTFRITAQGGRKTPISYEVFGNKFGCLFVYNEEFFDCFIILTEGEQINPGDSVSASIAFLRPFLVKPILKIGDKFNLRELEMIADGEIINIFQSND